MPVAMKNDPKDVFSMKRPHLQQDLAYDKQLKKDEHIKAFKNPAESVTALSLAARKKADIPIPTLLMLAVWSGLFISVGGAAALSLGGGFQYQTVIKDINGTSHLTATQIIIPILPRLGLAFVFPIGLILIILLGGELFTGNTMIMTIGLISKRITILEVLVSWFVSYFGNFAGTVVGAVAFWGMGTLASDPWHGYLSSLVMGKVNANFGVNLLKAIPANFLVCTAIAMANEAEDISGKVLASWWPIFTFAICGFEHSIANMFFVTLGAFYGVPINYGTFIWQNLIPVTIGNIIGGAVFMALVWWYAFYKPVTITKVGPTASGDIELGKLPGDKAAIN